MNRMDPSRKRILKRQNHEIVQSEGYVKKVDKSVERSERRKAKQEAIKESIEEQEK